MRRWVRDHGLLLANAGLFVVFFAGMVLAGVRAYNGDQLAHQRGSGVAVGLPAHRRLRRGDVRELGVRVPADGDVRRAHRVPVPARLVGVQAARLSRLRRTRTRGTRTSARTCPGRCAAAAWSCRSTRTRWPRCSSSCSLASIALHAAGGARAYSAEQQAHGEAAVSLWGFVRTAQFWFESFQNWQSRVPRGRGDRRRVGLPAAARLGRVEAGRRAAPRHRRLTRPPGLPAAGRTWPRTGRRT